jgi:hypothetical protein
MTVHGQPNRHDIIYVDGQWVNAKTGAPVTDSEKCATCKKFTKGVNLMAPSAISDDAMQVPVDYCLAPLIQMLNDYGVKTLGCCCGHGKSRGMILIDPEQYSIHDAQPGAALILPVRP